MIDTRTLNEAFIERVKYAYDAEHQILNALPYVIRNAESDELREALKAHLEETGEHTRRLEQLFAILCELPRRRNCSEIAGLIAEGEEVMELDQGEAALILALQKVERYEIVAYSALVSWARFLRNEKALSILQETLNEEKEADQKLKEIALETVNPEEHQGTKQKSSIANFRKGTAQGGEQTTWLR